MWLPTRVRYWQVHNAIVCLARLIGALEQLISVIVVVWWHSDYGFSFWVAPTQAVCTYLSRSLLTYLYVFLFVFTLHQSKCQIKYLKFEEFEVCLASHRFLWRQWCKHMVPTDLEKCLNLNAVLKSAWFCNLPWKWEIFLEKCLKMTIWSWKI